MGDFADAAIDGIIAAFPGHQPGTRPIHAPGITATGWFEGSPVAPIYTDAAHFAGARGPGHRQVLQRYGLSPGTGYGAGGARHVGQVPHAAT